MDPVKQTRNVAPSPDEERRLKALQLLHDLRVTFGMEELAREFLRAYVDRYQSARHADSLVTERILYRYRRSRPGP